MVLWPVINSLVILLIGYDVDLTRVVRDMRLMVLNRRISSTEMEDVEYGGSIERTGLDRRSSRSTRQQSIQGEPKIRVPPRCKLCGSHIDPSGYSGPVPAISDNSASSAQFDTNRTSSFLSEDPSGISAIIGSEYSSRSPCDGPYDDLQKNNFSPTPTLPTPELEHISDNDHHNAALAMYIPPPGVSLKQYASYSPSPVSASSNNRRKSYPPRRRSI